MPKEELITIERWRVDRAIDDLYGLAYAATSLIPEELRDAARAVVFAQTAQDLHKAEATLIEAALDYAERHGEVDVLDRVRAPCPLCKAVTQQTGGWVVPLGLNRHLTDKSSSAAWAILRGLYASAVKSIARDQGRPLGWI